MLVLTANQQQQLQAACEAAYPEEGCGLLLGRRDRDRNCVLEVRPTANVWDETAAGEFTEIASIPRDCSRRHNFAIAPTELLRAQKETRARGWEILGVFHSHTDAPAQPSEFDRAIAWSEYSYVILSVMAGHAIDWRCWQLDMAGKFQAELWAIVPSSLGVN
ncbi:MAG: M67 family metallopeptidase [Cyanobacteria bacterium J06641_5]